MLYMLRDSNKISLLVLIPEFISTYTVIGDLLIGCSNIVERLYILFFWTFQNYTITVWTRSVPY